MGQELGGQPWTLRASQVQGLSNHSLNRELGITSVLGKKNPYLYGLWSFYLEQGGLNPCKIWGKAGQTEVLPLLVLME